MFTKALLALSLTAGVSSAFAAQPRHISVRLEVGQTVGLGDCQGTATAQRRGSDLILIVANTRDCSRIENAYGQPLERLPDGEGKAVFRLPEQIGENNLTIIAQSKSGETSAEVTVHSRVEASIDNSKSEFSISTTGDRDSRLAVCGGKVKLEFVGSEAYLVFKDLQNCHEYDILAEDGQKVKFPLTSIDGPISLGYAYSGLSFKVIVRSERAQITGNFDTFKVKLK